VFVALGPKTKAAGGFDAPHCGPLYYYKVLMTVNVKINGC